MIATKRHPPATHARLAAALAALLALPSGALRAQAGVKVYISADLEGVTGAVTPAQLGPGGFEYASASS